MHIFLMPSKPHTCAQAAYPLQWSARCVNSLLSHKTFSSWVQAWPSECGAEEGLKPKTNEDQLWNRTHDAVEVKSDEREDDLFTLDEVLMLEVFVPGIYKSVCLRYFGTSRWGLCSNANMSGNVQQGSAWFHLQIQLGEFWCGGGLYFPHFQQLPSCRERSAQGRLALEGRGRRFSIDYSTIKVMLRLNNMTRAEYSWERWLTYSQFSLHNGMTSRRMETFCWKVNNECGAGGKWNKLVSHPPTPPIFLRPLPPTGDVVWNGTRCKERKKKAKKTAADWLKPSHDSLQRDAEETRAGETRGVHLSR